MHNKFFAIIAAATALAAVAAAPAVAQEAMLGDIPARLAALEAELNRLQTEAAESCRRNGGALRVCGAPGHKAAIEAAKKAAGAKPAERVVEADPATHQDRGGLPVFPE